MSSIVTLITFFFNFSNNNWDGFAIDKVRNGIISNNIARNNGRHGINVITGSENVLVINNVCEDNGYEYNLNPETQGNGITVQSNIGLTGDTTYITKQITIKENTIRNNSKYAIYFSKIENCTAEGNTASLNFKEIYFKDSSDSFAINNVITATNDNYCLINSNSTNIVFENNTCNEAVPVPNSDYFFVVASGSSMTKGPNDIVCNGENDHLKIQEAIDTLGGYPGTVELSDGTFNLGHQIELTSNLLLLGQGRDQTVLRLVANAGPYTKRIYSPNI